MWQTCTVPPGAEHLHFRGRNALSLPFAVGRRGRIGLLEPASLQPFAKAPSS